MKALIVKEDGLIYVNEVPEERNFHQDFFEEKRYKAKLASAIDSAIRCADQKKARKILLEYHGDGNLLQRFEGIYPIPDLQWEVKKFYNPTRFGISLGRRTLAILKESTPSVDQIIDDINGLVIYQGDEDTPSTEQEDKPLIDEVFADNGEHSHWRLIDPQTGSNLWSEYPEEDAARGYPVKSTEQESQDGIFPDAKTLARQLLEVRDNLVKGDITEAYHVLCQIADPELSNINHWEKLESLTRKP